MGYTVYLMIGRLTWFYFHRWWWKIIANICGTVWRGVTGFCWKCVVVHGWGQVTINKESITNIRIPFKKEIISCTSTIKDVTDSL